MSEEDYQKLLKKNPYLVPKGSEPIHLLNHPSGRSEHDQQVALFTWANQNLDRYPVLRWMFAVPNGGHRHPAVAGKLKAEGVKAGVLDIHLPAPRSGFYGLWLEMKAGKNRPTAEQLLWMDYLKSAGYCVRLCYSAKDAQKAIEEYLA
jgi:hypothetical protein